MILRFPKGEKKADQVEAQSDDPAMGNDDQAWGKRELVELSAFMEKLRGNQPPEMMAGLLGAWIGAIFGGKVAAKQWTEEQAKEAWDGVAQIAREAYSWVKGLSGK